MKLFLARVERGAAAQPGTVHENDHLQDLAGWDSIGALSLIALVDEQYGVVVDAGALSECDTVADVARLVEKGP